MVTVPPPHVGDRPDIRGGGVTRGAGGSNFVFWCAGGVSRQIVNKLHDKRKRNSILAKVLKICVCLHCYVSV